MKLTQIFTFLLLAATITATAQEKPAFTLQQAITTSLDKNFNVISSQSTYESQKSSVMSAYGNFLPSLSASAGWNRSQTWQPAGVNYQDIGGIQVPIGVTSGISTRNNFSAGLNAGVTLFDGFATPARLSRALLNEDAAEQNLVRTRQSVVYQTQGLYLNVLRTKSLVKVNEDNLKTSRQQLDRIVESNKVGAVALADVYRQQVTTANAELALIQAQATYENAKTSLLSYLSLDVFSEYDYSDASIENEAKALDYNQLKAQYSDYNKLVSQALEIRPDYKSAMLAKEGSDQDVTSARSGYWPTVSANASYSYSNTELAKLNDYKSLNYGLNISLPIFNGFRTSVATQQAQLSAQIADEQVRQTQRQVQSDVKKALLDLESAYKQLDVTVKNLQSAAEDQRIANERYTLGAGTLLDNLTAQANYTKAQSDNVNAAYNYVYAKQEMKYVIGADKY
ncbi:MAG TPA: TolC family protein [Bacteroidota bacterium]|nr:TolC family protein [Bacteroidota bacterium]